MYCICSVCLKTKLEQLLEIYPPEEVESRRWEKIAVALGNRTVKQVNLYSYNVMFDLLNHTYIAVLEIAVIVRTFLNFYMLQVCQDKTCFCSDVSDHVHLHKQVHCRFP